MKGLKLLSWNVWFDSLEQNARYREIFRLSSEICPDVVCFQEVTPVFLQVLKSWDKLPEYSISDECLNGRTISSYGVLTLVLKRWLPHFEFHRFPTDMGRKLLTAQLNTGEARLCIGNVHLESLDNSSLREQQLTIAKDVLSQHANSILCGDFNIGAHKNYDSSLPLENDALVQIMSGFSDTWSLLRGRDPGYTFDTAANPMAGCHRRGQGPEEQMRYDRVFSRLREGDARVVGIELVGHCPMTLTQGELSSSTCAQEVQDAYSSPKKETSRTINVFPPGCLRAIPLFASDHFGILTTIDVKALAIKQT